MEARKIQESVISRLVGLDEMPPPESTPTTKRVLSENYLRRVASIGAAKKRSCHERLSPRTGFKEKKEFKDGSQVVTIHSGDKRHEPKRFGSSLDLSVSLKPQTSLAFRRSPEFSDSRDDRIRENIPKKNSLVSKVVDNQQVQFSVSHSGDGMSLKSPGTPVHRNDGRFRKLRRRTEFGYLHPPRKPENGTATSSRGNQLSGSFHDTASSRLKLKNNAFSPNVQTFGPKLLHEESKDSNRYFSVPASHLCYNKYREFYGPDMLRVGFEVKDGDKFGRTMEFIRPRSASKKETSATKSESSSCSSDRKRRSNSFSFSDESFISEAKKLSERRPMAQNVKDVGPGSKDNTLGELFATQNHDSRRRNHKPESGRHGLNDHELNRFSKHGTKYEAFRRKWSLRSDKSLNLARLKLKRYNSDEDNGLESGDRKLKLDTSKSLPSIDSEDSHSYSDMKDSNTLQGIWTRKNEMNNKLDDCDTYKQNIVPLKPLISTISSISMAEDMVVDTETKIAMMKPSGKPEVEQLGSTSSIVSEESDDWSSCATDASAQQEKSVCFHEESSVFQSCYRMELDPMVNLEEACHPSPISVLERPFGEATMHGSELMGRTMDDISELRRHLELLQSETSETHSEEPEMAVSSDDENEEGLACESIENKAIFMKICRVEETRKFSYLIDVLAEASLNGRNLAEFSMWHSLDCPMSLSVFETLEKKYGDQKSWERSERRLLFDLMNAGLTKTLLPCMGIPTLEKSVSRRFRAIRDEEMLEEDLWKLLVCQEKECGKYTAEKMLESELGKLDLGDEIDSIGREIESLLFNELLEEIF